MTRVTDQYAYARQYLAGGVSASTRLNRAVGHPLYFDRAAGCRVWDLDGREYLDLCCSHGATLLGHGDARVRVAAIGAGRRAAQADLLLHGGDAIDRYVELLLFEHADGLKADESADAIVEQTGRRHEPRSRRRR